MSYNKFIVGDLLFVEYTCPITDELWSVWTQTDYIIHVLRGKKKLWTGSKEWMIRGGDSLYIRKGSFNMTQYFDDEFCMMGFFINDDFVRSVIGELQGRMPMNPRLPFEDFSIKRISHDAVLQGFFNSMLPFFQLDKKPSSSLLELKLKELVINFLTTDNNPDISSYFLSMAESDKPSIRAIMESNYCQHLSIEEFARMTHRSISTFKRDFRACYDTSPGKWLLEKRLEFSQGLLRSSDASISDIAYRSGFEHLSHFSRSFKARYGISPANYRSGGQYLRMTS
jgi:AraC-like DNA-binding protein